MPSFSIVEFFDDKTVEVVPSEWIVSNNSCYWPSIKGPRLTKLLMGKERLEEKNRTILDGKKVGKKTFESYIEARKHLDEAENTSSLETESETELRKSRKERKRKHHDVFVSSALQVHSESEDEDSVSLLQSRPVDLRDQTNSLRFSSEEVENVPYFNIPSHLNKPIEPNTGNSEVAQPSCTCQEQVIQEIRKLRDEQIRFQEIVITKLIRMDSNLNEVLQNINVLEVKNSVPPIDLPDAFPIKSYEDLKTVENWLNCPDNVQILCQHLASIGGVSTKETTRRILHRVPKGDISCHINWTGKNGKFALMHTSLAKVIISSVRLSHPSTTEKEVEDVIRSWFRFAKDREGGREKRRKETAKACPVPQFVCNVNERINNM